ncbi:hypothetical protein [Vibrio hippocampi]|uniref:Uncharacterized protein n=1 Tax=Vibrio hippocampi TaxID=654686 RepID=A0ABM8ZP61_9VIBR|nr:hypothetical protein [Vibrio hippocampi]CAH0529777.1 hypothetical protein VHP8226_03533 [Vibrio hippocampi]
MKIKKYIILFLLFSVFGCQSESEKDNSNLVVEALPVTINAQNFVVTSEFGQSLTVDLDNKVAVSDKSAFTVSSIERLTDTSADCATPKIHNASLLISPLSESATAVCDYRYTVTSAAPITNDSVVSGVMRLVAPSPRATVTVLDMMPISAAVLVDGGVQTIDIAALLADAGEVLTGFTLLSTYSHAYPYAGGVTISSATQTLDYTPAATVGHDRILFTYTNTSTNTNKLGILDIVVGESHNQGVTLIPTCYYPFVVPPNIETALDITTCVKTDHDGNDYGLNRVDAFYASVAIASAAWNEKNINFKASENRYHDVSYMIDDGKGGTEMGILRVAVGDADQLPGWEAIELSVTQYYTAPKSVLESLYSNTVYSELLTDSSYSPAIDIAGYYPNEAIGYCQSLGASLPTTQQLQDLVNNPAGKPQTLKDWPMAYHYLANDGTVLAPDYRIVNLDDGTISTVTSGEAYFVSCYKGEFSIALTSSSRCAVPGDTLEYKTTVTTPFGPYANEYIHQSLSPTPTTAAFSPAVPGDNYFTDANGQFDFGVQDSTSGAVTVTATVDGLTVETKAFFGYADIFSTMDAFSALKPDGTVVAWGAADYGGDASAGNITGGDGQLENVVTITGNGDAFAALKEDGTVVAWGYGDSGGDASAGNITGGDGQLENVVSITGYGRGQAFAALKEDGTVVAWGNAAYGGDASAGNITGGDGQLENVVSITANERAFAALKKDGTVVAWGAADYGGDASAGNITGGDGQLENVVSITAKENGFVALKKDGTVVAWGYVGDIEDTAGGDGQLENVVSITVIRSAFAALKEDGTVVGWGNRGFGGYPVAGNTTGGDGQLENVVSITGARSAFAALKKDGTVVVWGWDDDGGDASAGNITGGDGQLENVVSITSDALRGRAFAALKEDGTVVAWGHADYGGDASAGNITGGDGKLEDVVSITTNGFAFAALKKDGTVVAWGDADDGGDASAGNITGGDGQLENVLSITSNEYAFAALKEDGSVVAWGGADYGGDASGVDVTHCD